MIDALANSELVAGIAFLGGALGAVEIMVKRKRSPRGGLPWMGFLFAVDALAAVVAFAFLNHALSSTFLPDPLVRALAALVWSPLLLRTQIETLLPGGPIHDFLKLGPAVRLLIDERIDVGSAGYRSTWLDEKLIPALPSDPVDWVQEKAKSFYENRTNLSDSEKESLASTTDKFAGDLSADPPDRVKAICQLLIDNGGLGVLKAAVRSARSVKVAGA